MTQLDLFPDINVDERERLYVIGNGFDLHHEIESKYWHFKKWCQNNKKDSNLVGLMDIFFSNDREFWGDIENALGEYNEEAITDYCEPENPKDFKFEHPGQWQNGVEDSISWIFGQTMELFREGFNEWVQSIDISNIVTDLFMPKASKYLTFNYTETLNYEYGADCDSPTLYTKTEKHHADDSMRVLTEERRYDDTDQESYDDGSFQCFRP